MARRSQQGDPEALRRNLIGILEDFEDLLLTDELRLKVRHLIPAYHKLRDLGASLITSDDENSRAAARQRMLLYMLRYVSEVIDSDELMVVAGIQDYPRRIRELRVEQGWSVISGKTVSAIYEQGELDDRYLTMQPNQYALLSAVQDRDAAHRWRTANDIRKGAGGAKAKLLTFFRANVGVSVSGEELAYVSNHASNWQRRVRELRTEEGWPVFTRMTGDTDLPVGTYILREDKQEATHDRVITDVNRITVLQRDNYSCRKCGWTFADRMPNDPRTFLELHHLEHHVAGGSNEVSNLITLCNIDHDDIHRLDRNRNWGPEEIARWLQR